MSIAFEDRGAIVTALQEVSRVLARGPYGPTVLCQHGAGEPWFCGHPWDGHYNDGIDYECVACYRRGGGTEEHCFRPVDLDPMDYISW